MKTNKLDIKRLIVKSRKNNEKQKFNLKTVKQDLNLKTVKINVSSDQNYCIVLHCYDK